MNKPHVLVLFGTRPEAIKLAPVVHEIRRRPDRFDTTVCVTAQHRQMLDQVLETFDIRPDIDLDLMTPNQTLASLTARILTALDGVFEKHAFDAVLVQGDTTTVMTGALAAFYRRIPVGHVEAGLRTDRKYSPFPEEINRRLATQLADWHFAPTERARENLLRENVPADRVYVTGNPVIDALFEARRKIQGRALEWGPGLRSDDFENRRLVAITGHRRENFGDGFQSICRAIRRLAERFPDIAFVYPVHLNPNVQNPVGKILSGLANVHLIEPLDYLPFVSLLEHSELILTDSGGVQEEAPSLGKPVLVMRDTTERPEAVEAGTVILVGADEETLFSEAERLLTDRTAWEVMSQAQNPYGDGTAARRIVDILESELT